MQVLVTGAAGMVGRTLIPELIRIGVDVVAISRSQNPYTDIPYYQGDIARSDILSKVTEGIDCVIHSAANVRRCGDIDCVIDNVYATYIISQWSERRGVGKILYLSTSGVYDTQSDAIVATEKSRIRPTNLYTLTKYLGESILGFSRVSSIVMRFTYLYSPLDKQSVISKLTRDIFYGRSVQIMDEQRDYLHAQDAVRGILLALNYSGKQRVLNFGTGKLTSMAKIAEMAMKHCNQKVKVQIVGSRRNLAIDSTLARNELGWQPSIALDEGIKEIVKIARRKSNQMTPLRKGL